MPRRRHSDDHQHGSGLNFIENPWQGSFAVDSFTHFVEEAVYKAFEAISERGGVLGAMDAMYQRGKIQEESMYYEHKKHDGSLLRVGVNMFLPKEGGGEVATEIELIRSTEEEKGHRERPQLAARPQCPRAEGRDLTRPSGRYRRTGADGPRRAWSGVSSERGARMAQRVLGADGDGEEA